MIINQYHRLNLLNLSEDDSDRGDVSSDSSTHTIIPETFSDNDSDFNTDLPTRLRKMEMSRVTNLKPTKGNL